MTLALYIIGCQHVLGTKKRGEADSVIAKLLQANLIGRVKIIVEHLRRSAPKSFEGSVHSSSPASDGFDQSNQI